MQRTEVRRIGLPRKSSEMMLANGAHSRRYPEA